MKKLTFKVKGANQGLTNEVELSAQLLANHIQHGLNGTDSTEFRANQLTQQFVDYYGAIALFHSGTFLGFKIEKEEEADDKFLTFKKK